MKPGRLPQDHPLEQQARDKLRAKSPQAAAKTTQQQTQQPAPNGHKPQPPTPTRW